MSAENVSRDDIREEDRQQFEELCKSPEYVQLIPNKLLKKIIKHGDAGDKCPETNATVIVHYHGTFLDGKVFDSSVNRGEPFEFHIGQGAVIKAWDQGVATMNLGEKCQLICHPDVAYGSSGSGSIPAKTVLSFEVELLDFVEDDHEYPSEPEEKLKAAKARQEAGKKLFSEQKYRRANAKYEKAAELVEFVKTDKEELQQDCQKLRATMFANMCLCQQKMGHYMESVKKGEEGIKIIKDLKQADNELMAKIYSRMVKSYTLTKKYEEAVRVGEEGLKELANNALILKELQKAKQFLEEENKKRRSLYAKMMSFHSADAGNTEPADSASKKDV